VTSTPPSVGRAAGRTPGRGVLLVHISTLACAVLVIALTAGMADWSVGRLVTITLFTVVSGLMYVQSGSSRLKLSGSFLGLMLAAVTMGGGPAALVGMLTIIAVWFRSREAGHYFRNNFVTYALFPLSAGLIFRFTVRAAHLDANDTDYYLLVFAIFILAMFVNWLGVGGYQCYLDRTSLWRKTREAFAPVLAAELFSALLTVAAVYVASDLGTAGIAMFGVVLIVFQYLVGELLESKRRGEELHRMATTDELTGLPNREHFRETISGRIASSNETGEPFGILLMDLDRFKEVNDTLGHDWGDRLLAEVGSRLVGSIGTSGVVARLGGDEFAILPPQSTDDPAILEQLAAKLLHEVQQPFLSEELSIDVGASIGIVRFPRDGADVNTLMRRADVAMYAAKSSQTGCKLYEPEADRHSVQRLGVLSDVRRALEADEIVVHFQPIVDLMRRRVSGAEGLVRWQHPDRGLLPPAAFIPAVEQTGLIRPLTMRVLNLSLEQCAIWRRTGNNLSVAVNLSVRNLLDPELPTMIQRLLDSHGLGPDALQLEITETMLMFDPERVLATVKRLNDLGMHVSVDDFGTGYSSLAVLRQLPVNELKIDRSFVSPMLDDESDLIIVRSTINLGHDLGLKIIAEGVEDARTMHRLADLGCDLAQGYHLSRPIAPEDFGQWVAEYNHTSGLAAA
jgi:diguanylate cyclase (GGDEF)-like protein